MAELWLLSFIDFFEVAVVIGACFLVNSVTDDAKTNWAEGVVLLGFYLMVVSTPPAQIEYQLPASLCLKPICCIQATAAWFYDGQQDLASMLFCKSVSAVLGEGGEGGSAA